MAPEPASLPTLSSFEPHFEPAAEQDLFVARAVLQTLAVASRATVAEQYSRAQALLTALQALSCVPDSPLSHAVGFLLHAVQVRGLGRLVTGFGTGWGSASGQSYATLQ